MDKIATKNIEIVGYVSDLEMIKYLQKAKAFIFNSIEDFGILPVEAQLCGTPVIALGIGGVKETVINEKTGLFYDSKSPDHICEALQEFEKKEYDFEFISRHAQKFSIENFCKSYKSFVEEKKRLFFD